MRVWYSSTMSFYSAERGVCVCVCVSEQCPLGTRGWTHGSLREGTTPGRDHSGKGPLGEGTRADLYCRKSNKVHSETLM